MAPPASDRWELPLASRQSRSMFAFFFISAAVMPALSDVDGWSVIYGLGPLIPDPLMMVVNWWEAKGWIHL